MRTEKCRCGKSVCPDSPTSASFCPALTVCPGATAMLPCFRWQ
ncbi:MAG: hypothetical protein WDN72_00145 [Alphaproteobacteria bacterium]